MLAKKLLAMIALAAAAAGSASAQVGVTVGGSNGFISVGAPGVAYYSAPGYYGVPRYRYGAGFYGVPAYNYYPRPYSYAPAYGWGPYGYRPGVSINIGAGRGYYGGGYRRRW